jgi:hypothetical protein
MIFSATAPIFIVFKKLFMSLLHVFQYVPGLLEASGASHTFELSRFGFLNSPFNGAKSILDRAFGGCLLTCLAQSTQ